MRATCIQNYKRTDPIVLFQAGKTYAMMKREADGRYNQGGFFVENETGTVVCFNFSDYRFYFLTVEEHREKSFQLLFKEEEQ